MSSRRQCWASWVARSLPLLECHTLRSPYVKLFCPCQGASVWYTDGWLGLLSASISTTSKTLAVSIETDRGSYNLAGCWLQDVEGC